MPVVCYHSVRNTLLGLLYLLNKNKNNILCLVINSITNHLKVGVDVKIMFTDQFACTNITDSLQENDANVSSGMAKTERLINFQISSENAEFRFPLPFPVFLRIGTISGLPGGQKL